MAKVITTEQYELLSDLRIYDRPKFHERLKEYTGIVARHYDAFEYYDNENDYIGDSTNDTLEDLLRCANIYVDDGSSICPICGSKIK